MRRALFAQNRTQKRACTPLRHRTPARGAALRLQDGPSDIAGLAAALLFHRRGDVGETMPAQQRLEFAVGPPLGAFELAQIGGIGAAQGFEYSGPLLETR